MAIALLAIALDPLPRGGPIALALIRALAFVTAERRRSTRIAVKH